MLDLICEIADFRAGGGLLSDEEIRTRIAAASNGPRSGAKTARASRGASVAVIPIYGVISQRAGLMANSSGGTSVEGLTRAFRESIDDGDIGSIVFDVDSPGGSVDGIEELASEIRAARGTKPIAAVANTLAASAAYWIASAADELVVTPSGQVGSIGVIAAHVDDTLAREAAGIKRTVIATPPGKADGFDGDVLSAEGALEIQSAVDGFYSMFVSAVSKGRGVGVETVRQDYGSGRVLLAKPALAAGMVDRIDTLDATIARAARGKIGSSAVEDGAGSSAAAFSAPYVVGSTGRTDGAAALVEELEEDEDLAVALDSGLPFASHLSLVSDQVDALVSHAREHVAMRARSGRSPSATALETLSRIRDAQAELDSLLSEPDRSSTSGERARAIAAEARIRSGRLASPSLN
jgi:signal peptide peptidase SppA